jgi:hypothetical protein
VLVTGTSTAPSRYQLAPRWVRNPGVSETVFVQPTARLAMKDALDVVRGLRASCLRDLAVPLTRPANELPETS